MILLPTRSRLAATASALLLALSGCGGDDDPASGSGTLLPGFRVTVYYTPVESFHSGPSESIAGCPSPDCSSGPLPLGAYPSSFLAAVRIAPRLGARFGRHLGDAKAHGAVAKRGGLPGRER